jgi:hypothetical protein
MGRKRVLVRYRVDIDAIAGWLGSYKGEHDEFIFPMTVHPDVSGRLHALLMHERLIEHINKHEGVEWVTMGQIVDEFKSKKKSAEGDLMPAAKGAILKENRSN